MNTHEFQAKQLLKKFDIPVSDGIVIESIDQFEDYLKKTDWKSLVIKVQIHAGGRGKAGGIQFASTPEEARKHIKNLLKKRIVNEQTGKEGLVSHFLLLCPAIEFLKESYVGAIIDRNTAQAILILSSVGGMDIEALAHTHPESILRFPIPYDGVLKPYHLLRLTKWMGWTGELAKRGSQILKNFVKAFVESDATLFEINPLVETAEERLVALDAKLIVDENAIFRHTEYVDWYDRTQVSSYEALAHEVDLAYVSLQGNIGCIVNGAGLAMATMDIIHHYGGQPANFLDVGGGASQEKIAEGFKIILSDPHVKAVLINIFGGIMNCETLANGIIEGSKQTKIPIPIVVRMEGTNVEKGIELLTNSGIPITIAKGLDEAAKVVTQFVN